MKKNYNKQVILAVLLVALLIAVVGGVTYAFFNYTRTGVANTIQVGRIAFNSTQNNTITLENVFPTATANLNSSNSDTVTITITGDTTYSEGIEYKVTLEDVNNTVNDKEVPISFNVTANNLGTKDTSYYTNRGGENPIYNLIESGQVEDGKYILVGYIPSGEEGVNGSIDITAFIDASNVAISDTVSRIENGNLVYGETPGDWIAGREVFTTTEWNSFNNGNPLSFKVRVEANEGIWVEEPKILVMKNLYLASDSNWTNIRGNITSIEFLTSSEIPSNAITSFDATDITSDGPVKVYTLDDGLGNGTYKAVIVADGIIYAPDNCVGMFFNCTNLVTFNSKNFKVDNVTNMNGMFQRCNNLTDVDDLINWNVSNVTTMASLFNSCTSLVDISALKNWNTSKVTTMKAMFSSCTNLANVDGLANWNTSNVTTMEAMFTSCTDLANVDGLANWNTSKVTTMGGMFYNCTSLTNISGLINWNTSKVTTMYAMFASCTNLANVDGLANWNTPSVTNMQSMFASCTNLANVDGLANWNTSNVTNMLSMFDDCTNLANVDGLANWNVSNVTDMKFMFYNCTNLANVDGLANWNTSNVTNMQSMFNSCINLEEIDLSNWKTNSLTNMNNMFGMWNNNGSSRLDSKLKRIILSDKFDTSNVTDMYALFANNTRIEDYSFLQFLDTSNVQNMSQMFQNNNGLISLEYLSTWNVLNATTMVGMFRSCNNLTDASGINDWNINASANFTQMFAGVSSHPEFTQVAGTWDSEGTFTPNA